MFILSDRMLEGKYKLYSIISIYMYICMCIPINFPKFKCLQQEYKDAVSYRMRDAPQPDGGACVSKQTEGDKEKQQRI